MVRRNTGLFLGIGTFIVLLLLPAPQAMPQAAWRTTAVAVLMAIWWITEVIPIPATALLPLALFPLLGVMSIGDAAAPFANPVIYLFMGGFMLALALEKSGLHRRIALGIISRVGTRPANLIAGFMGATALISMWVSNTATVVMMLPIAQSIISLVRRGEEHAQADHNFASALLLGVAYAASIGGMGTLIGTPPNALLAGFMLEVYDVRIGFARWMMLGVPIVVVALPLCWLLLVRFVLPQERAEVAGGKALIGEEARALGPMSPAEKRVAIIAAAMAVCWVLQPLIERVVPGLSDTGIAVIGALLLFLTPVDWGSDEFVMDWKQTDRLPWGILILFGGGLSLAAAIQSTGLAGWIGDRLIGLQALPVVMVTVLVATAITFVSELASNTATAAAFLPVAASVAVAMGVDVHILVVTAALAASCGFMLPVATPPNAIVYGTGDIRMAEMMKAGWWLNLIMIAVLNIAVFALGSFIVP